MTALPSSLGRDTRQFRLLSNDAVRRLLNTALSSRDTDPVQFALWMVALVGTPPTFYAFNQTLAYASLRRAPAAVVERVAMGDRLFFVIYAMLASALLAALTWEALFPDRTDQEIVGVLPVRPWTVAPARLGAAATMAIVYAIAINAPAALLFAFTNDRGVKREWIVLGMLIAWSVTLAAWTDVGAASRLEFCELRTADRACHCSMGVLIEQWLICNLQYESPIPSYYFFSVASFPSFGAPVPEEPKNSFFPSGSVRSRPLPLMDPSFA